MAKWYYSNGIDNFLNQDNDTILGQLTKMNEFSLEQSQRIAWSEQIRILKGQLSSFLNGHIFFEYTIPRIGKRIDNVFIYKGLVFLLEFKVGSSDYSKQDINQALDYALDLKNFHKESHNKFIVPILIATQAKDVPEIIEWYEDGIVKPIMCNNNNITRIIESVGKRIVCEIFSPQEWGNSFYSPSPTIIEAAQALYSGHSVIEISRSDAGATNLSSTTKAIESIIEGAKCNSEKRICFVTGVPGSGKTLVGLSIANHRHDFTDDDHAVFLSGNGPLVEVLIEALARNEYNKLYNNKKIEELRREAKAFIQNIHHFRDEYLECLSAPTERVVIFDEAQRAWTMKETSKFMDKKKGRPNFDMSEPEFLIQTMDRHIDWAVIICLVGGGQEIGKGEAGLSEWMNALNIKFPEWNVYVSGRVNDTEYIRGSTSPIDLSKSNIYQIDELHLKVSLRSFRSEKVSDLVGSILDRDADKARILYALIQSRYKIMITRDLNKAKAWIKEQSRGSERYGIIASSGANRLRPYGIWVNCDIDPPNWFLNDETDVRSSCHLEYVATEFDIQGLELDWAIVAWDADLRYEGKEFHHYRFRGSRWENILSDDQIQYLKNSYRVLLTRARQGMIIYIPFGDGSDHTRKPSYYNGTYEYLKGLGIEEL